MAVRARFSDNPPWSQGGPFVTRHCCIGASLISKYNTFTAQAVCQGEAT